MDGCEKKHLDLAFQRDETREHSRHLYVDQSSANLMMYNLKKYKYPQNYSFVCGLTYDTPRLAKQPDMNQDSRALKTSLKTS